MSHRDARYRFQEISPPKSKKSELQIQNIGGGGPKFSKKSEFHKQGVQKGIKTLIRPLNFFQKFKMF